MKMEISDENSIATRRKMEKGKQRNGSLASALKPKHIEQWEDQKRDELMRQIVMTQERMTHDSR